MKRREWTEAEIIVLCGIFSVSSFSVGDDEKEECKRIATQFGRSPATIDRQWRNVKDYIAGYPTPKVGSKVKYWAQIMLEDPTVVRRSAEHHCEKANWDLIDLVKGGK